MRNKKAVSAIVCIMAIVVMLCFSMTAYASPGEYVEETQQQQTEAPTQVQTDAPTQEQTDAPTQEQTDAPTQEQTEAPTDAPTQKPQQNQTQEQKEDSLPKVDFGDILVPETIKVPDTEVSESSLIGGVISWLCVAVGVAVLAGVLVSQRTKLMPRQKDSRRR